jgi:hypothetical protein
MTIQLHEFQQSTCLVSQSPDTETDARVLASWSLAPSAHSLTSHSRPPTASGLNLCKHKQNHSVGSLGVRLSRLEVMYVDVSKLFRGFIHSVCDL